MKRQYLLLVCIYILVGKSFAQEVIVPLQFNPVIKSYIAVNGEVSAYRSQVAGDTLYLPFEDDFSEQSIYPSTVRWDDNKVFINSDFGRNMPTVGVATFDGLDELGNAYIPGSTSSGTCDVLTSKPLYLHTKPNGNGFYDVLNDSIYISFFYEKKGYGDAPDATDSLVLEFYRPDVGTWTREWFLKGGVTGVQE